MGLCITLYHTSYTYLAVVTSLACEMVRGADGPVLQIDRLCSRTLHVFCQGFHQMYFSLSSVPSQENNEVPLDPTFVTKLKDIIRKWRIQHLTEPK